MQEILLTRWSSSPSSQRRAEPGSAPWGSLTSWPSCVCECRPVQHMTRFSLGVHNCKMPEHGGQNDWQDVCFCTNQNARLSVNHSSREFPPFLNFNHTWLSIHRPLTLSSLRRKHPQHQVITKQCDLRASVGLSRVHEHTETWKMTEGGGSKLQAYLIYLHFLLVLHCNW